MDPLQAAGNFLEFATSANLERDRVQRSACVHFLRGEKHKGEPEYNFLSARAGGATFDQGPENFIYSFNRTSIPLCQNGP